MINMDDITTTIKELESGSTTFDSCMKLAALYTIQDRFVTHQDAPGSKEILPQYKNYCRIKRKYQMHEIGESVMFESMQSVCKEMDDFVHTLYSNTDTTVERALILNTLQQLVQSFSEVTV